MRVAKFAAGLLLALPVLISPVAAAEGQGKSTGTPAGELPRGLDGQPLNLDFEKGTLEHWSASGEAFRGQPVKGDTVTARGRGMKSEHAGEFWIGGYEITQSDEPQGTLTSAPFRITAPFASFRIAGGSQHATRVDLVERESGKVLAHRSGDNSETLRMAVLDLQPFVGKEVFLRLVDESSVGWGHLNFDDFRLHATRPALPPGEEPSQPDDYPFAGLSPEEAAKAMVLPEGFSASLVAGEPDVKQPIAMAMDDRGRLWIAEAYTYPLRAPEGKGKDRILIFEDADGDGRFEKRKVFIENLNLVSGLEVGFGGVWIGAAPYLLFVPDKNGDDQPDGEPQVLLDGWGYQDTHETLNTFTWGPDGWLYGCHGVFTHSSVGKPGAPKDKRTPLNAGVWRYHPTRHTFEVFAQGTSNPWGLDFNEQGQAFVTACVIPHLFHMIQGGRYHRQGGEHFNRNTFDDIKTIALHRHWIGGTPHAGNNRSDAAGGGHAHAGAMIYLGGAWPRRYHNQIFMNNIHGQRLNQDQLAPKGSGYEGDRAPDFCLTRDRWSQILNLQYGPDGQAYMIDWYDQNACHHFKTDGHDRTNGRIFRIAYKNAPCVKVDLAKASEGDLVGMLHHKNDWYARHARRLLQERGMSEPQREKLATVALFGARVPQDESQQLRILWALHATGGIDDALALKLLHSNQPYARAWTLQLLTDDPQRGLPPTILAHLAEMGAGDSSPVVRLYLASALQRLPSEISWTVLPGLLARSEDAGDHNLPLMYWYATEPLATRDAARALRLTAEGKIPLVFSFMVRRLAKIGEEPQLDVLAAELARTSDPKLQLLILQGINEGLKGRRRVPMPKPWPAVSQSLMNSNDAGINSQATALALTFGDPAALEKLRGKLVGGTGALGERKAALDALLAAKDPQLAPTLQRLVDVPELRAAALRGLANYDDPATAPVILKAYAKLNLEEKRDALATLAARAGSATALLNAVSDKKIAATDLPADLIRQLRNLNDATINERIGELWGTARESSAEKAEQIGKYTQMVQGASRPGDAHLGRTVFVKTCNQCHTLFGTGGKIGPELTGSNRANLEYLLSNILDPSAVMAKEYQPSVIVTGDGRVITGIVKQQDDNALNVQTATELLIVPRGEVEEMRVSQQSMMPDDLLKQLSTDEVRGLVSYLAGASQVPQLATADNLKNFFNGRDLTGWEGDPALWSVDNGEIVGRTAGLKENTFLKSDMAFGDFRLRMQVKLVDNRGNSGVQFRSEVQPDGLVRGYQADVGPGWWGKLYEEHGRGLLWAKGGEQHVQPGWNAYEIEAVGSKLRTWLNGHLCVDLEDTGGARRGIFALQLHSGDATEVRFKDLEIELNPERRATAAR